MAKFNKTALRLQLGVGDSGGFIIETPSGVNVHQAKWQVKDIAGKLVKLPDFSASLTYTGARVEHDNDGLYVRAGERPTHVQLHIECEVTTIDAKKKISPPQKLTGKVTFFESWGGVAKAMYPYPENYEHSWVTTPNGPRAVMLLWEAISLLPQEFKGAAAGMPIILTSWPYSLRGSEYRGAHLPVLFDTIQINKKLVDNLSNSATITPADVEFIKVVIHEIAHAVTYKGCLWDVHNAVAMARKQLRHNYPGAASPLGWPASAVYSTGGVLTGIVQNFVWPQDTVSDFAAVSGWELAGPLAHLTRLVQVPKLAVDIWQWIGRLPSQGLNQDYTIRPNLLSGSAEFGWMFGLKHTGDTAARESYEAAKKAREQADWDFNHAAPADKTKRAAELKRAKAAEQAKLNAWGKARSDLGLVSHYAASDVLEDIAETLTFYLLHPDDLAKINEYFGNRASKTLKKKRKFFADQHYLPRGNFPALKMGSMYRGNDTADHLDKWQVEL